MARITPLCPHRDEVPIETGQLYDELRARGFDAHTAIRSLNDVLVCSRRWSRWPRNTERPGCSQTQDDARSAVSRRRDQAGSACRLVQ